VNRKLNVKVEAADQFMFGWYAEWYIECRDKQVI